MSMSILSVLALSLASGTTEPPSSCSEKYACPVQQAQAMAASNETELAPQDIVATAIGAGSLDAGGGADSGGPG